MSRPDRFGPIPVLPVDRSATDGGHHRPTVVRPRPPAMGNVTLPTFRPGPWQDMAPVTSRQDVLSGALLLFVLLCGAAAFFAGLACLIGIIWSFFVLG